MFDFDGANIGLVFFLFNSSVLFVLFARSCNLTQSRSFFRQPQQHRLATVTTILYGL